MKLNIQHVIGGIIVLLLIANLIYKPVKVEVKTEYITVPEIVDTTDVTQIEEPPIEIKYIKGDTEYVIDSTYYDKYLEAQDSLSRLQLYVEAIQIKEYTKTLVDNDTISIEVSSKTRGSLISQFASYKIKQRRIEYKPKTIKERPAFTLLGGITAVVPTVIGNDFMLGAKIGFQNKKGHVLEAGYFTNQSVLIGYSLPLFKIN